VVEGGAGSKDGGSVELPRSVEEEVSEDFSKDVLVEREESKGGHFQVFVGGKRREREEEGGR